jgi:hypothetical protein
MSTKGGGGSDQGVQSGSNIDEYSTVVPSQIVSWYRSEPTAPARPFLHSHSCRAPAIPEMSIEISRSRRNFGGSLNLLGDAEAGLTPSRASLASRTALPVVRAVNAMPTLCPSAECPAIDPSNSRSLPRRHDKAQLTLVSVHTSLRWRPRRFSGIRQREERPTHPEYHPLNGKGITRCSKSFTSTKINHLKKSWII